MSDKLQKTAFHEFKAIADYFRKEGRVVKDAPISIALFVVLIGGMIAGIFEWHYSEEINTQTATIENLKSRNEELQEELKGASPRLAAIQARRIAIRDHLLEMYIAAGPLIGKGMPKNPGDKMPTRDDVMAIKVEAATWEQNTAEWLNKNLGPAAQARFLDVSNMPTYAWLAAYPYDDIMNHLVNERKNLAVLIETSAYDK